MVPETKISALPILKVLNILDELSNVSEKTVQYRHNFTACDLAEIQ